MTHRRAQEKADAAARVMRQKKQSHEEKRMTKQLEFAEKQKEIARRQQEEEDR